MKYSHIANFYIFTATRMDICKWIYEISIDRKFAFIYFILLKMHDADEGDESDKNTEWIVVLANVSKYAYKWVHDYYDRYAKKNKKKNTR